MVEPLLRGRFGRPYLWSESCASTQDVLRGTDLPEGAVAVTEHQTSGRGREGRPWEDVAGKALLLSLLLRPPADTPTQQLALVAGLAVAEAVEERRDAAGIKWPNDVLLDGRKVAGVLLEASDGSRRLRDRRSTSRRTRASFRPARRCPRGRCSPSPGAAPDRAALLAALLEILEHRYDAWCRSGLAPLLDELEARNVLRGQRVEVGGVARGRRARSRPTAG